MSDHCHLGYLFLFITEAPLQFEPRCEKMAFAYIKTKDADQLRGNREADQRLGFRYTDTTIPLSSKSKISSF